MFSCFAQNLKMVVFSVSFCIGNLATGRCSIQLETVRLLGASPNSRDSEGANIFAWYVETIKDRHKNQISYTYKKQDGVLYPLRIEYDQGVQLAAYPKVEFRWEHVAERTICTPSIDVCVDDHRISYRKGFRVDYFLRLTQVTVTGYDENSQPEFRIYDIAYKASKSYGKGKKLDGPMTMTVNWHSNPVDLSLHYSFEPAQSYMGGSKVDTIRPQESAPGCPSPATSFEYFDVQEDFQQRQEFSWPHDGAAWRQSIHSTQTKVYSATWPRSLLRKDWPQKN